MSPFLIDSRALTRLVMYFMAFSLAVFSVGFISGYQRANEQQLFVTHSQPLPLPALVQDALIEAKAPAVIAAGAEIDVDLPDSEQAQAQELELAGRATGKPPAGIPSATKPVPVNAGPDGTNEAERVVPGSLIASKTSMVEMHQGGASATVIKNYSIQAGTYKSLRNAKGQLERLQQQQLDAYITTYINTRKQLRYNVRFGYFADKKQARKVLADYRKQPASDGYVVKYSAENIVDLASPGKAAGTLPEPTMKPATGLEHTPAPNPDENDTLDNTTVSSVQAGSMRNRHSLN